MVFFFIFFSSYFVIISIFITLVKLDLKGEKHYRTLTLLFLFPRGFLIKIGPIISLAWDHTDTFIYTGSSNSSLRKYDVQSGRALQRMTMNTIKGESTIVWSLIVLK